MTRIVRIALMIEGQEDVTWEDWVALAEQERIRARIPRNALDVEPTLIR